MALSAEDIAARSGSFTARKVHVPEWATTDGDDVVFVRGMTLREYEVNMSRADEGKQTASILARCLLNEQGDRLFSDKQIDMLAELPIAGTAKVNRAIMEESGLNADSAADTAIKVAVASAEGNSPTTRGVSSSSDSLSA